MTLRIRDITNIVAGGQKDPRFSANREYDGHEQVVCLEDEEAGFLAFIGVHSTNLGEALGGCRYRTDYRSADEAITDVLRLSRGMTYKNAMAGLALGGGKAVIMGPPGQPKPGPDFMDLLARGVESLKGRYVTAEDMNTSEEDMMRIWQTVPHVCGIPLAKVAADRFLKGFDLSTLPGANPSPYTAHGTLAGIRAAVRHRLGRETLEGVTVAVKGAGGAVGSVLCGLLHREGARLIISDWDGNPAAQARLADIAGRYGAKISASAEIMAEEADVFAPCAKGADINDETIALLKAKIVAGCANNVLAEPRHADALHERGILYAPDYVINAGGVICAGMQHLWLAHPGAYAVPTHDEIMRRTREIGDTLARLFRLAESRDRNTADVADSMAREAFGDSMAHHHHGDCVVAAA